MIDYSKDIQCLNYGGNYINCISDPDCYNNGLYCYPKDEPDFVRCQQHGTDDIECTNDGCTITPENGCIPFQSDPSEYNRCVYNGVPTCIEEGCQPITLENTNQMCVPIRTSHIHTHTPTTASTTASTEIPIEIQLMDNNEIGLGLSIFFGIFFIVLFSLIISYSYSSEFKIAVDTFISNFG
jgi:hypothetical protein